jgi:DNA-binding SARP family transcriptional activator
MIHSASTPSFQVIWQCCITGWIANTTPGRSYLGSAATVARVGEARTFRILGPLSVEVGGQSVPLGGPRQRSVLALLLLNGGQVVPVDRIIDALWEGEPPAAVESTLRGYVSHLRKALGSPSPLVTRPSGYQLDVAPDQVDADQFEHLSDEARGLLRAGRYDDAAQVLRAALRLWRGPALADLANEPWARAHCARLDGLRELVIEARVEADLQLGRHLELVSELHGLVTQYPLRERLHAHRMMALYRAGRQADALDAYREAYEVLAGERGIEPSSILRQLEGAILRQDPSLDWKPADAAAAAPSTRAGAALPVPAELPADTATFTGRAAPLAQLDALLTENVPTTVVISAIAGAAGIGKTTLAVHWGHRVRDRFPDGQLYVNLRGYAPGPPVQPIDALARFLRALGVPPEQLPVDLDEAAARYRSLLADRRVLVLLDNAVSAEQVRPLLPASSGCLVIVTSRDKLTGLVAAEGAHPIPLDLLTAEEATALLARRLGRQRIAAEPGAADQIVARCARLPLALSIVAARAAMRPTFPLATVADELPSERGGLDAFVGGDSATDVRAIFSWSYHTLSAAAARMFRLLGLNAGLDIAAPAAASLAGVPVPAARAALGELTSAHLVDEHKPGRWAFHDLLRAYAAELARAHDTEDEQGMAVRRLLDHYLHTSHTAAFLLNRHRDAIDLAPPTRGVTPAQLGDAGQAVAWFTAEHQSLLAAATQAAAAGFDTKVWQLVWTLWDFFDRRGHWRDWAVANNLALASARRLGDRRAQGLAHRGLGRAYAHLGHEADAQTHYQLALDAFTELGDLIGQARTHLSLASVYAGRDAQSDALTHSSEALRLFRAAGNAAGQARALNAIGWQNAQLGNYTRTLDHCKEALALQRRIEDRRGEAATLDSIGFALHHLGQYAQAIAHYQESLARIRELGDRSVEGEVLTHLGDTYQASGDAGAARDSWQQALLIISQLGGQDTARVRHKLHTLPAPSTA